MTVVTPQDFAHHYGREPDGANGRNITANVLRDYLQRMSGAPVQVRVIRGVLPAGISWQDSRGEEGTWVVTVGEDSLSTADVMRMASTMLFTINKGLIQAVTKRMTDPRVKQIATTIEKARTEWLGDMWFNSTLADETRVNELRRNLQNHTAGEVDYSLEGAIRRAIYAVPGQPPEPVIQAAMARFSREIRAAVRSLDQAAGLNLAVDIADYMDWHANQEGGQQGDQPGDPESEGDQGGQSADGDGDQSGDAEDSNKPPGQQGGNGSGELPKNVPREQKQQQPRDDSDFESDTAANRKRIKSNIKRNITRRKNKVEPVQEAARTKRIERMKKRVHGYVTPPGLGHIPDTGEFKRSHSVEIRDIGGEPVDLDEFTKLTLGTYVGNRPPIGQLVKRGAVSPMNAWKLSVKGDTRIFRRPPLMKGHVSILVDISGSMGCWCSDCHNRNPDDMAAYLAWQVTGLLGQLHPTAEVFAYSGGRNASAKIIPLGAGEQPAGCAIRDDLTGGTPTCTAMLYFQDHLQSRPSGTTAIIVTDGGPDSCTGYGMNHVDYIGRDMLAQGIKFGTVFIGQGRYLNLPAEVSVNVSTLADIANIQPLLEILDR